MTDASPEETMAARIPQALVARGYAEQDWFLEVTARMLGCRWIVGRLREVNGVPYAPTSEGGWRDVGDIRRDLPGLRMLRYAILGTGLPDVRVPYFHVRIRGEGRIVGTVAPGWVEQIEKLPKARRRALALAIHHDEAALKALMLGGLDSARAVLRANAKKGV